MKKQTLNLNYKGFWTMLALMFGFTIFSASMLTGGSIGAGLKPLDLVLAMVFGNAFLAIYGALIAYVSHRRQKSLDYLGDETFGKKGSYLMSIVMNLTQIGWFGVGIAMIAIPMEEVTHVSKWLWVFLAAGAIISTAFFGIKSLTLISLIAVPLVIIIGFTSIGIGAGTQPVHHTNHSTLTIMGSISLIISTFISGATFVPNFAPNANTTKNAVITTGLAFLIGNGIMITFGILGYVFYKDGDLVHIMINNQAGLVVPGLIMLVLNIWTTNDSGLFSISAGMNKMFKVPKKISVVVIGLAGAGASIYLYDHFIDFLNTMNRFVPGIGAIFIVDYFFRKREKTFYGFNVEAIICWALGAGLTFIPELKDYAPLISLGITGVTYGWCVFVLNKWGTNYPKRVMDLSHVNKKHEIAEEVEIKNDSTN